MDGMRQRIGRVKSVSQKRPPLLSEGWSRNGGPPVSRFPHGSSIKVDGRPGAIVRRSMHEISIYNDVKDRRTGAFVIQREARDPVEGVPGPIYISRPRDVAD